MQVDAQLPAWSKPLLQPAPFKSARGGRGSSKSHTFAQLAVLRMAGLLPAYPREPVRIASARMIEGSITQSVKQTVESYIRAYGLEHEFDIRSQWINHRNGSHMFFPGIERKIESFLSIEGVDVLWIEQAEALTKEHWDLIGPSIRKNTAERWFTWNPYERTGWCFERFVARPQPGDISLLVNYMHNPWFDETGLEEQRAYDEEYEPTLYKWKWLGHPLDTGGRNEMLPYDMLKRCVKAFEEGFAPNVEGLPLTHAGLDLAEGGMDKCALVVRQGPVVLLVDQWPGIAGDLSAAAARSKTLCEPYDIIRIYYDASSPARTDLLRVGFKGVRAVNFGGSVGGPDELYEANRPNKEVFAYRNVQMGDAVRLRMNRTSRLMNGEDIDPMQCLFIDPRIPDLEHILGEWSQPTRRWNVVTGKWEVEKAAVDEKSPDRYDALILSFGVETDLRGLKVR